MQVAGKFLEYLGRYIAKVESAKLFLFNLKIEINFSHHHLPFFAGIQKEEKRD